MKELLKKFGFKDLFYMLLIGVLLFFGWRAYKQLNAQIAQSEVSFNKLSDTIARAQNEIVTKKELDKFVKEIDSELKKGIKDIKALGGDLKAVGLTVASLKGILESDKPSDNTTPVDPPEQPESCKLCDVYGYTKVLANVDLKWDDFKIGSCSFAAGKEKPWALELNPLDFKIATVMGQRKNGTTLFYHTVTAYNKTTEKSKKLTVVSSEYKEILEDTTAFHWWAPQLDFNLDNNLFPAREKDYYKFGGSVGLSLMGYGQNTSDLTWRFLHIAAGLHTQTAYLTVTPVKYNIGKNIILFNDLWIGVGVSYSKDFGLNISLGTRI
jgi:hypothetical protein